MTEKDRGSNVFELYAVRSAGARQQGEKMDYMPAVENRLASCAEARNCYGFTPNLEGRSRWTAMRICSNSTARYRKCSP